VSLPAQIFRRAAFVQMRVAIRDKIAAKGVNPIARRPHEVSLLALIVAGDGAGVLGHVQRFEIFVGCRRSSGNSPVIIGVGFGGKLFQQAAACRRAVNGEKSPDWCVGFPVLETAAANARQPEAKNQQREQQQKKCARRIHLSVDGLRRKTRTAAMRKAVV